MAKATVTHLSKGKDNSVAGGAATLTFKRCKKCNAKWAIEQKGETCPECPTPVKKKKETENDK